jgi:hypothetical protein
MEKRTHFVYSTNFPTKINRKTSKKKQTKEELVDHGSYTYDLAIYFT